MKKEKRDKIIEGILWTSLAGLWIYAGVEIVKQDKAIKEIGNRIEVLSDVFDDINQRL